MTSIFSYTFMINALIATIFASISCGISGSFVVEKKIAFISGGLAHAIMGGIGIAYFLGYNTTIGAIIFAGIFSLILTLSKNTQQNEDTLVGALWAVGMSIGIIFMNLTPGYGIDLSSFIFGNILMVSRGDLISLGILTLIVIFETFLFYYHFLYVSFDEDFMQVNKKKVNLYYFLLLLMISFTVIVLIKIVGLILLIALLTIPTSCAKFLVKSFKMQIFLSIIFSLVFTISGILLAVNLNLTTGPTIILLSSLIYIIMLLFNFKRN